MNDQDETLLKPYLRGYRRMNMLRDLAEGKMTVREVAAKYGVTETAIYTFKGRPSNAEVIADIQQNLEDEFAGMWIANKKNRIDEYQADVERINNMVDDGAEQPQVLLKVKHGALRSVAEEMGHLKQSGPEGERVKLEVHIVGTDSDAL